jgi:hypothetical protein
VSYPNPHYAPKKKKSKAGLIALVAVLVTLVLCGFFIAVGAAVDKGKPVASPTQVQVQVQGTEKPAAAPVQTTAAATPAAPKVPTISDGTYTVGEDFPAGTYKTVGAGDKCYWAIFTSGQNQSFDALIDNHLGGGNLRVTLKAGQDFETKRCGTWTKA